MKIFNDLKQGLGRFMETPAKTLASWWVNGGFIKKSMIAVGVLVASTALIAVSTALGVGVGAIVGMVKGAPAAAATGGTAWPGFMIAGAALFGTVGAIASGVGVGMGLKSLRKEIRVQKQPGREFTTPLLEQQPSLSHEEARGVVPVERKQFASSRASQADVSLGHLGNIATPSNPREGEQKSPKHKERGGRGGGLDRS